MNDDLVYEFLAVFCGSGGQTLGLLEDEPRMMGRTGRFVCRGGIDNDPVACEDYERLTGSKAWCLDVMAMRRFWSTSMFRAAFGQKAPHVVVVSAPCKGSSRLLSAKKAKTKPYRQLNRLAAEFLDLMLEAWGDSPPALILFENVPGFPTRAKATLRSLKSLLRTHGYVFHASTHDCGEIGGLAQHRERYLLVARHPEKCGNLLYEPAKKRVRGVGEVLSALPMPATVAAKEWGELHTMPRLSWKNWLRLGLIPAGGDWRDLAGVLEGRARREVFRRHAVEDWTKPSGAITGDGGHAVGAVDDPRIRAIGAGDRPGNWSTYGVTPFDAPSGAIAGEASPSNGRFSVADPRIVPEGWHHGALGVRPWDEHAATVTSGDHPSKGRFSVADPRALGMPQSEDRHQAKYAVKGWDEAASTVIGQSDLGRGTQSVADPRIAITCDEHNGGHGVMGWDETSGAIVGSSKIDNRKVSVADPRGVIPTKPPYDAAYGVVDWAKPARAIAGTVSAGTGAYAIADPRTLGFVENVRMMTLDEAMALDLDPEKAPPFIPVIVAEDGTWHRPLTLLELAALQSIPARMKDGSPVKFSGTRTEIAQHIGNMIPKDSARWIARQMLLSLMGHDLEAGFLQSGDVWVSPPVQEMHA